MLTTWEECSYIFIITPYHLMNFFSFSLVLFPLWNFFLYVNFCNFNLASTPYIFLTLPHIFSILQISYIFHYFFSLCWSCWRNKEHADLKKLIIHSKCSSLSQRSSKNYELYQQSVGEKKTHCIVTLAHKN